MPVAQARDVACDATQLVLQVHPNLSLFVLHACCSALAPFPRTCIAPASFSADDCCFFFAISFLFRSWRILHKSVVFFSFGLLVRHKELLESSSHFFAREGHGRLLSRRSHWLSCVFRYFSLFWSSPWFLFCRRRWFVLRSPPSFRRRGIDDFRLWFRLWFGLWLLLWLLFGLFLYSWLYFRGRLWGNGHLWCRCGVCFDGLGRNAFAICILRKHISNSFYVCQKKIQTDMAAVQVDGFTVSVRQSEAQCSEP